MTHGPRGTVPRQTGGLALLVPALLAPMAAGLSAQQPTPSEPPGPTVDLVGTDRFSGDEPIGSSYVRLPEAREIAMARSAAPPAVSADATIWVLRSGRYQVAVEGSNGNGCMVSRTWPTSAEPICYDAEGVRTLLPIEIEFVESRIALGDREAARAAVDAHIESGALPLPERPSMTYMLSSAQRLVADGGRAVGAWRPHFMMYVPYLRSEEIGIHGSTSQVFVAREGEPLAHVITVAAQFIDPEESR